jgi:hypothetical protein
MTEANEGKTHDTYNQSAGRMSNQMWIAPTDLVAGLVIHRDLIGLEHRLGKGYKDN